MVSLMLRPLYLQLKIPWDSLLGFRGYLDCVAKINICASTGNLTLAIHPVVCVTKWAQNQIYDYKFLKEDPVVDILVIYFGENVWSDTLILVQYLVSCQLYGTSFIQLLTSQ
jgi:hypothetical protein